MRYHLSHCVRVYARRAMSNLKKKNKIEHFYVYACICRTGCFYRFVIPSLWVSTAPSLPPFHSLALKTHPTPRARASFFVFVSCTYYLLSPRFFLHSSCFFRSFLLYCFSYVPSYLAALFCNPAGGEESSLYTQSPSLPPSIPPSSFLVLKCSKPTNTDEHNEPNGISSSHILGRGANKKKLKRNLSNARPFTYRIGDNSLSSQNEKGRREIK